VVYKVADCGKSNREVGVEYCRMFKNIYVLPHSGSTNHKNQSD